MPSAPPLSWPVTRSWCPSPSSMTAVLPGSSGALKWSSADPGLSGADLPAERADEEDTLGMSHSQQADYKASQLSFYFR